MPCHGSCPVFCVLIMRVGGPRRCVCLCALAQAVDTRRHSLGKGGIPGLAGQSAAARVPAMHASPPCTLSASPPPPCGIRPSGLLPPVHGRAQSVQRPVGRRRAVRSGEQRAVQRGSTAWQYSMAAQRGSTIYDMNANARGVNVDVRSGAVQRGSTAWQHSGAVWQGSTAGQYSGA